MQNKHGLCSYDVTHLRYINQLNDRNMAATDSFIYFSVGCFASGRSYRLGKDGERVVIQAIRWSLNIAYSFRVFDICFRENAALVVILIISSKV